MKKIFALVLAISLVACMALSVSAADANEGANSETIYISLNADTTTAEATKVFSVDLEWANTNLVYQYSEVNTKLVWNPETHTYTVVAKEEGGQVTGGWVVENDAVAETTEITATVTNHSNKPITATLSGLENKNNVTFAADQSTLTLESADVAARLGDDDLADSKTFTVTVGGIPTGNFTINFTITLN